MDEILNSAMLSGYHAAVNVVPAGHGHRLMSRESTQQSLTHADSRVSALLEIAAAINSTLDFKMLLKVFAKKAAQACGFDRCSIFLWRDGVLLPVMSQYASGVSRDHLWRVFKSLGPYHSDDVPAFGRALRERRPVLVEDVGRSGLVPTDWFDIFDLHSVLVFPLLRQDLPVGIMHFDNCLSSMPFNQADVDLGSAIASQLALAIDNARLVEETRNRLQETATLLSVGRTVGSTLDLGEVARRLSHAAAAAINADSAGIYVSSEDNAMLKPLAGYHVPKPLLEWMGSERVLHNFHHLGRMLKESGHSLWSDDVRNDPRFEHEIFRRFPMQSILVTSLEAMDELLGVLVCVWWTERRRFLEKELRLIEGIADQAAIAIANARLYAKAEELAVSRERLRMAQELHHKLSQSVFSMRLTLEWCLHQTLDSGVRSRLEQVKQEASAIMGQMRQLIYELTPESGSGMTFAARLRKLVDDFRELSGLAVEYGAQGDLARLGESQQEALLKALQESLANIVKHARASHVSVRVDVLAEEVQFEVRDDGIGVPAGFRSAVYASSGHLGLFGMIERIKAIGGEIELNNSAPSGFCLRGKFPVGYGEHV
ncbi:MAG: GAF domain-containing sensor histidine kinase [Candidatus Rokubacteria bacterium]|nr:GAF domain-containing sensor histidine kinase [Candidatus Rokubacteria bacterium]